MEKPLRKVGLVSIPLAVVCTLLWPAPAAGGPGGALIEGSPHPGPRAYHAMCARAPGICRHDRQAGRDDRAGPPARMSLADWRALAAVNTRLNARIRPAADVAADHWTEGSQTGDCEDYAIAKKLALIERGWAADQVLITIVEGRTGGHHAVLVVRTDTGEHVLDNLTDEIRHWQDTGYRFVIRQSAAAPHVWVHVGDAPAGVPERIVTR